MSRELLEAVWAEYLFENKSITQISKERRIPKTQLRIKFGLK